MISTYIPQAIVCCGVVLSLGLPMSIITSAHAQEPRSKEPATPLLTRKLIGAWEVQSVRGRKKEENELFVFYKSQQVSNFVNYPAGAYWGPAKYTVDETHKPAHVNLEFEGKQYLGLVEMSDGNLRIALPLKPSDKRVKSFDADGVELIVARPLQRKFVSIRPASGEPPKVKWCTNPHKFSVRIDKQPLKQAIAAVGKAADLEIELLHDFRDEFGSKKVSLDLQDTTIWQAFEQLNQAVGGDLVLEPGAKFAVLPKSQTRPVNTYGTPQTKGVFHIRPIKSPGSIALQVSAEPQFMGRLKGFQFSLPRPGNEPLILQSWDKRYAEIAGSQFFLSYNVSKIPAAQSLRQVRVYALLDVAVATEMLEIPLDTAMVKHAGIEGGTFAVRKLVERDGEHMIDFEIGGELKAQLLENGRSAPGTVAALVTPAGDRITPKKYGWGQARDAASFHMRIPSRSIGFGPVEECSVSVKTDKMPERVIGPLKKYAPRIPQKGLTKIQLIRQHQNFAHQFIRIETNGFPIKAREIRLKSGDRELIPKVSGNESVTLNPELQLPLDIDLAQWNLVVPIVTRAAEHALEAEFDGIEHGSSAKKP